MLFISSKEIDLTGYKDEWNAEFPLEVIPERPLARYELTATDVTSFLREYPEVTKVRLTLKYDDYLPKGFNAWMGLPNTHLNICSIVVRCPCRKTELRHFL